MAIKSQFSAWQPRNAEKDEKITSMRLYKVCLGVPSWQMGFEQDSVKLAILHIVESTAYIACMTLWFSRVQPRFTI